MVPLTTHPSKRPGAGHARRRWPRRCWRRRDGGRAAAHVGGVQGLAQRGVGDLATEMEGWQGWAEDFSGFYGILW